MIKYVVLENVQRKSSHGIRNFLKNNLKKNQKMAWLVFHKVILKPKHVNYFQTHDEGYYLGLCEVIW